MLPKTISYCHVINFQTAPVSIASDQYALQIRDAVYDGIWIFSFQCLFEIKSSENGHRLHTGSNARLNVGAGITDIHTVFSPDTESPAAFKQEIGGRFFPGDIVGGNDHFQQFFNTQSFYKPCGSPYGKPVVFGEGGKKLKKKKASPYNSRDALFNNLERILHNSYIYCSGTFLSILNVKRNTCTFIK